MNASTGVGDACACARGRRLIVLLIFCAALGSARIVSAADPRFLPEQVIVSRSNATRQPMDAQLIDFDGDGDLDLVTAGYLEDKVTWYENDGGAPPRFIAHVVTIDPNLDWQMPEGFADGASSIFAADLDKDGRMDVLVAAARANMIAWFHNDGGSPPAFTPRVITTSAMGAAAVRAADLNGDGHIDVVSASPADNHLVWYKNDGQASPTFTAQFIDSASPGVAVVAIADLDGDGDLDVLAGSDGNSTLAWYESSGGLNPSFIRRVISSSLPAIRSIVTGDVDHDGDLDVVVAVSGANSVIWFENNGAKPPAFTAHLITASTPDARSVFLADLDGDNDLDVLVASYGDDRVTWYENDGAAHPSFTPHVLSDLAFGANIVVAGDLDGDHDVDIVAAAYRDDKLTWFENQGGHPPTFHERTLAASLFGPLTIYTGDLDGDGDIDIAVASHLDDKVSWLENDGGSPPHFESHTIFIGAGASESIHIADADGDGDLDIIGSSVDDNTVAWYENMGGHPLHFEPHILNTNARHAESVWTADLAGNGHIDILSASSIDDKVAWYENLPQFFPLFPERIITVDPDTPLTGLNGDTDGVLTVRAADMNHDGHIDVLTASFFDNKIAWFENSGTQPATFTLHVISTNGVEARSVFPADIDGDGKMDAVSAYFGGNNVMWHENIGGSPPQFVDHVIATDLPLANWVYVADLNNDGHPDIVTNSIGNSSVAWLESDGNRPPSFTEHILTTTAVGAWSVHADDLDGDGDLDIISASFDGEDKIVWFENRTIVRRPNNAQNWMLYK